MAVTVTMHDTSSLVVLWDLITNQFDIATLILGRYLTHITSGKMGIFFVQCLYCYTLATYLLTYSYVCVLGQRTSYHVIYYC